MDDRSLIISDPGARLAGPGGHFLLVAKSGGGVEEPASFTLSISPTAAHSVDLACWY